MGRRNYGDETWHRLKNWTKGSKEAERLASQTLRYEGFKFLDPSHPHGGPDQGKDIICYKNNKVFLVAVTFSKNELSWSRLKKKFKNDFKKMTDQQGFIFFTNQEITVAGREELKNIDEKIEIDIYHLERVSQALDSPPCYGVRLEFLDIDMTKEEQISFISSRDEVLHEINDRINEVIKESKNNIPTEDLREFQNVLNQITGFSNASQISAPGLSQKGHVSKLRVPLDELKEFKKILQSIAGSNIHTRAIIGDPISRLQVPISQLKEFKKILTSIVGEGGIGAHHSLGLNQINKLQVPLQQLKEYEETLDRIIEKKNKI
ncbi:MAG: hypothetical protein SVR94_18770 [Pseudomonadota bacterium]|nr:hypothetical protein [Pseudomonadota bacterium]